MAAAAHSKAKPNTSHRKSDRRALSTAAITPTDAPPVAATTTHTVADLRRSDSAGWGSGRYRSTAFVPSSRRT